MRRIIQSAAWEQLSKAALVLFYLHFMYLHGRAFIEELHVSSLILAVFESMIVVLVLLRKPAKSVSLQPVDWFIAVARTYLPLLLVPVAMQQENIFLQMLQAAGFLISVAGIYALNRSIGMVAANRGIKTGGIYRFVRHPLYAGYVPAVGAFVAQNLSLYNIVIASLFLIFAILSILAEEELLSQDPEYQAYQQKTRWRIIPGLW